MVSKLIGIPLKTCVSCMAPFPKYQDSDKCVSCRKEADLSLFHCDGCGMLIKQLSTHKCVPVDKRVLFSMTYPQKKETYPQENQTNSGCLVEC